MMVFLCNIDTKYGCFALPLSLAYTGAQKLNKIFSCHLYFMLCVMQQFLLSHSAKFKSVHLKFTQWVKSVYQL